MKNALVKFWILIKGFLYCSGIAVAIACIVRTATSEPACALCGKWNATVTVAYASTGKWQGGIFNAPEPELQKYMVHFCENCNPPDKVPSRVADSPVEKYGDNVKGIVIVISSVVGLFMGCGAWGLRREVAGSLSFVRGSKQHSGKSGNHVGFAILFLVLAVIGWRIGILWQFILLSGIGTAGEILACMIDEKRKVIHADPSDAA